jgi:hypothetical protein
VWALVVCMSRWLAAPTPACEAALDVSTRKMSQSLVCVCNADQLAPLPLGRSIGTGGMQ